MNRSTTLRVRELAFGGAAVGQLDSGKAAFVQGAAPGELVRVEIEREQRSYAQARLLEVLEPAAERVIPACPNAHECGGCDWQHLDYQAQLAWKQRLLERELKRAVKNLQPDALSPLLCAAPLGFRTRTRLHRRNADFGTMRRGSEQVIPLSACPILDPDLERFARELAATLAGRPQADAEIELYIDAQGRRGAQVERRDSRKLDWAGLLSGLGIVALRVGRGGELIGEALVERSLNKDLRFEPGCFVQTNRAANQLLLEAALQMAGSGKRCCEVYAGAGNFSVHLAERFGCGDAAEADRLSGRMLKRNLAGSAIEVRVESDRQTAHWLTTAEWVDLLLLDPPRAGIRPLLPAILRRRPGRIVLISCHPMAALRDIGWLVGEGRYGLRRLQPVEMFPQSCHLELAALLEQI